MNISKIVDMLKEDSRIVDGIPDYLKKMNDRNIEQIVEKEVVVKEAVIQLVSFAEMHGGLATERDVSDALALIKAESIQDEAKIRFEKLQIAIFAGEVTDTASLKAKFVE